MESQIETPTRKKRGPKTGARGRPVNPTRLRKIVEMRDTHGWPFSKIAQHLGDDPPMTEQAIYIAYTRWADWVRAHTKPRASSSRASET
jgi:hypothetical protein